MGVVGVGIGVMDPTVLGCSDVDGVDCGGSCGSICGVRVFGNEEG